MKRLYVLILIILFSTITYAQCNGRYQTEIFSSTTKTTVNYSDVYTDNAHQMDIYTPDGDSETNRPVILYMHGGSFYAGDKASTDCVDFCEAWQREVMLQLL
jgi:acetyl esterase/lipase